MPRRYLVKGTLLFVLIIAGRGGADAHGLQGPPTLVEPPTKFERFLLASCSPCVRHSYWVTTLPISQLAVPGGALPGATTTSRAGEVKLEVLRAYALGKASQQSLALRATLSVAAGGGNSYRVAAGVVDEENLPVLATAIADISRMVASAMPTLDDADNTDMEVHTGSIRIGVLRTKAAAVAYIQAADDVRTLAAPDAWELQSALFFSLSDLRVFGQAIDKAVARIQKLRGK
jgi:hypothetical protein